MLAPDDDAGAFEQLGLVAAELAQQDAQLVRRLVHGQRIEIDQDDEDAGPLDVAQKAIAQALASRRALDQSGDVGHHELGTVALSPHAHHPEMRFERGERVVGDLGPGGGDGGDQRRLPGVGEADQGDVRHQLELHV